MAGEHGDDDDNDGDPRGWSKRGRDLILRRSFPLAPDPRPLIPPCRRGIGKRQRTSEDMALGELIPAYAEVGASVTVDGSLMK
jgi:hypothetical protein